MEGGACHWDRNDGSAAGGGAAGAAVIEAVQEGPVRALGVDAGAGRAGARGRGAVPREMLGGGGGGADAGAAETLPKPSRLSSAPSADEACPHRTTLLKDQVGCSACLAAEAQCSLPYPRPLAITRACHGLGCRGAGGATIGRTGIMESRAMAMRRADSVSGSGPPSVPAPISCCCCAALTGAAGCPWPGCGACPALHSRRSWLPAACVPASFSGKH